MLLPHQLFEGLIHNHPKKDKYKLINLQDPDLKKGIIMDNKTISLQKNGFKTSEFWATTLTLVASSAAAYAEILPPKWAIGLSTLATIAYTFSRTVIKAKK